MNQASQNASSQHDRSSVIYYKSLTRKLIVTIIVVSIVPMILVSGVMLEKFAFPYG